MMQQALFELAPEWPSGWSRGAVVEDTSSQLLSRRRRVVEYTHVSGARLMTSEHWHLSTGEYIRTNFRALLSKGQERPAGWVPIWSYLMRHRPENEDGWNWLTPGRDALPDKCPSCGGQWVFVHELAKHLGLEVEAL